MSLMTELVGPQYDLPKSIVVVGKQKAIVIVISTCNRKQSGQ